MGPPFYARIRGDVLAITASIPAGRIATFADIGGHLDVMPRHVAYILAMLSDIEKATLPWHRVVSADGRPGVPRAGADGTRQRALLEAEGTTFDAKGRITDAATRAVAVDSLAHGVPRQTRPATAPKAPRRR